MMNKKLENVAVAMHCNLSRTTSRQSLSVLITRPIPILKYVNLSVP